jgi:hypothetical protein
VGGLNGQQGLRSAEMFDPDKNQWTFIHSMNSVRSGVNLVAYEGHLYALGGLSGSTRLKSGNQSVFIRSCSYLIIVEVISGYASVFCLPEKLLSLKELRFRNWL